MTLLKYVDVLAEVALRGRDELNGAMPMGVVVPLRKSLYPESGLHDIRKRFGRIARGYI